MNSRLASLILLPLAGFGLGWWSRGPADREVVQGEVREAGVDSRQAPVPPEGPVRPGKRPRVVEEGFTEADRRREAADRRRMQETCRRKLELKVEEWGRLLGFDAAEMDSLRAAIGPAMEGLDPPVADLALPGLEKVVRSMLEGDRSIAFEQLGLRRQQALDSAKVEARLAEIGAVLLLDPAQQAALRESLAGKVERLPDPAGRALPGLSPETLAEINRRLAEARDGSEDDESAFRRIAGDVVRESIDADLEGLAEFLSPDQLGTYRQHLEERHAPWLLPLP